MRTLFLITWIFCSWGISGIIQTASGQSRIQLVLEGTSSPVVAVTVLIDGKELGRSDDDGWVTIPALTMENELCFLGLETMRKCITGEQLMGKESRILYLKAADHRIEEIAVNSGYEQFALRDATGSYTVIDQSRFDQQVRSDILSRLEGLAPGLLYNKRGGVDNRFTIRGQSTIDGDHQPLIIVDEFPYEGDISLINPED